MRAAILAVGSELLGTERLDTNSLRITETLNRFGVDVHRKAVVGDDRKAIRGEVETCVAHFDVLVVTGGLGPTSDDVTREGVALALGRPLERRPELERWLEERFASFQLEMPDANRCQCDVIAGAEVLANPRGTAPGQRVDTEGATVFLFPGVPRELEGMIEHDLEPWLRERRGGVVVESRWLKVACVPESTLEQMLQPFYREFGDEDLTILSSPAEISVGVIQRGTDGERDELLRVRMERLEELIGDAVFARSTKVTLEDVVGEALRAAGRTVVTAESCTGGLIAKRLTDVAGSSDYFLGGVVTYANELKTRRLGVAPELIERHGAVSEQVVVAMARGARSELGGDYALATSGVAGPGGGSDEKPVGTVDLALAGPGDDDLAYRRVRLPGGRKRVRQLASQWALDMLRRELGVPRRQPEKVPA